MKIIGSSKIDDYKKTVLEDSVLRAINAKPGDSVLFYKRQNDSSVCIYRAEGAQISSENDTASRPHLEKEFNKLRMILLGSAVMSVILLILAAINFSSVKTITFVFIILVGVLTIAGIAACIFISQKLDAPFDSQSLVTIGGPYSKNRLTGLSRMTSDGYVISGDLFINSLFGANPSSVDVEISLDGEAPFKAVIESTKSVPGYSMYKIRFKETEAKPGSFVVKTTYSYIGKSIIASSSFAMNVDGNEIKVIEQGVEANIEFDATFNSTEFDDILYNPSDE